MNFNVWQTLLVCLGFLWIYIFVWINSIFKLWYYFVPLPYKSSVAIWLYYYAQKRSQHSRLQPSLQPRSCVRNRTAGATLLETNDGGVQSVEIRGGVTEPCHPIVPCCVQCHCLLCTLCKYGVWQPPPLQPNVTRWTLSGIRKSESIKSNHWE